ncbi:GNAT family N-acetyltransferase [Granulosicoccaceae sp. 1_MG-2023]|nr:GNAT family N-acetyltransferase [Granulosicoccaceae sp. 1_MG-2023]
MLWQITPARIADIPDLCALLNILFEQERDFSPDSNKQSQALKQIIGDPSVGEILVARQPGKVLGMVSLLYTVSTALGGRVALLEDMIIDPQYRHKGIGKSLLDSAVSLANRRACLRLTLLTDANNHSAQQFYRRAGFARSAMVPMRLGL